MATTADIVAEFDRPLGRAWVAKGSRWRQGVDILDVEFEYDSDVWRTAIRFQGNADVRMYGNLITETGAIQSYGTVSITAMGEGSEDIISFRNKGSGGGSTERVRIASDGSVKAAPGADLMLEGDTLKLDALASGTAALVDIQQSGSAVISFSNQEIQGWSTSGFTLRARDGTGTEDHQPLTLSGETLTAKALYYTGTEWSLDTWGGLSIITGAARRLDIMNDAGAGRDLVIRARSLEFVHLDGPDDWGKLWSDVTGATSSNLDIYDHFLVNVKTKAAAWKDLTMNACNVTIGLKCSGGEFEILNPDLSTLFSVGGSSVTLASDSITLASKVDESARMFLDSTATSGAKKWAISSDDTDGALHLTNQTDSGPPEVRITAAGSLYTDEFLGSSTVTAAPADGDGEVGAQVVDTTNKRLWVKMSDSGTKRWWYVDFTQPA